MRAAWSAFKLIYAVGKIVMRFFLGRNGVLSGERKTNATFLRPATASLDPSGTALRWEKIPGWQRLLWRLGVLYSLLLSLPLLLLFLYSRAGGDLPPHLRPSFILLSHGAIGALLLSAWFTRRSVERHGYRIPLPAREERALLTDEEIEVMEENLSAFAPDSPEAISLTEKITKGSALRQRWSLRWIEKEGRFIWEKEKVLPVAGIVSTTLGVSLPLLADKRRAVSVPRRYRDGEPIIISLPADFAGMPEKSQASFESKIARKLGVRELSSSLQLEGSAPRILLRVPAELPELVTFAEAERYLLASEEFSPLYGVTASGEWLNISMQGDSPHMGVSAGSGAGKSEMIKVLCMQALRWGWNVIILDWKEESQEWIKGMDGVRYVSDIESIHEMGETLGEEVEERKANPGVPRPKVLVVCEEWSLTADLLSDYWGAQRSMADAEEKRTMPTRSPALTGFKKIIYTGRSLGMFEMLVAIRFSARVTGGNADLRESFQVILMARYKAQTVKMLAPGIKPFPANRPKERGRWVAVMGDEAVVFRAPLVTNEEARKFALGGVQPAMSPFIERGWAGLGQRGSKIAGLGEDATSEVAGGSQESLPVLEGEAVEIKTIKLSELAGHLLDIDPSMTYKKLQKARDNSDETGFPAPFGGSKNRGWTYDLAAVRMWTRSKTAARMIEERR